MKPPPGREEYLRREALQLHQRNAPTAVSTTTTTIAFRHRRRRFRRFRRSRRLRRLRRVLRPGDEHGGVLREEVADSGVAREEGSRVDLTGQDKTGQDRVTDKVKDKVKDKAKVNKDEQTSVPTCGVSCPV